MNGDRPWICSVCGCWHSWHRRVKDNDGHDIGYRCRSCHTTCWTAPVAQPELFGGGE